MSDGATLDPWARAQGRATPPDGCEDLHLHDDGPLYVCPEGLSHGDP